MNIPKKSHLIDLYLKAAKTVESFQKFEDEIEKGFVVLESEAKGGRALIPIFVPWPPGVDSDSPLYLTIVKKIQEQGWEVSTDRSARRTTIRA